jgi:hypothetical protein
MPYHYGHPFYLIRNYDVPDRFYPMGDLEQTEGVQRELNATRSQMMNARKKDIRKYIYRKTAFSPKAIEALGSDKDNELVEVTDDNFDLDKVIIPLSQTPVNAELYRHSELVEKDLEKITGVSDYMRGAPPETTRTATEASIIQDAINARAADKLSNIETAVREVARRLVSLAQQYVSTDQVMHIVGNDGASYWVEWKPEDIKGEFIFDVEAGSTQPKNETFRRQQAVQMMNAFGPFLPTGFINIPEFLKYVLQFGFDVKNPMKFISMPMAPPMPGEPAPGQPQPAPTYNKESPPPENEKPKGQRSSEGLRNQLSGQVGLQQPNGGGALGPGGQA